MRLLAVLAHPDDELGCVGTLAKHAARGDAVKLVWTTHGELASQFVEESEEEVRRVRQEHGAWVVQRLGASHQFFDMGDSRLTGSRAEALELARLYAEFKPDVIITWSDDHPHPDHRMTAKIAFDAITLARIPKILNEGSENSAGSGAEPRRAHRKPVRFYQYLSFASPTRYPTVHIDTSEHIGVALDVFGLYRDFYGWALTAEQFERSRASRGREVGVAYAEVFEVRGRYAPPLEYLR